MRACALELHNFSCNRIGVQGFLSESGDAFVQDVVYKAFTPTIGLFLAVSTAYGLWKQRQEQGQS